MRYALVVALVTASNGCGLESARLPNGSRRFDKPWRAQWYFALEQASRDFNCPTAQIRSLAPRRSYRAHFSGCGQSARYSCERRERRADQDIEQELDHIWEVYYVCRRQDAVSTP